MLGADAWKPTRGTSMALGQRDEMKREELEVFSEASNYAIVRPPGRNFPGAVIQGDSLSILCAEARAIASQVRSLKIEDEEFLYLVQEHQDKLLGRLLHYQRVLAEHGITLPYSVPAQESDLVVLVEESPDAQS